MAVMLFINFFWMKMRAVSDQAFQKFYIRNMSNTTINDIITASNKIKAATKRGKADFAWLTPEAAMAIRNILEEAEKTNIRIENTKMLNN